MKKRKCIAIIVRRYWLIVQWFLSSLFCFCVFYCIFCLPFIFYQENNCKMLKIVYVYKASIQLCLFCNNPVRCAWFLFSSLAPFRRMWQNAPYDVYNKGVRERIVKTYCTVKLRLSAFKMSVCWDKQLNVSERYLLIMSPFFTNILCCRAHLSQTPEHFFSERVGF